jgi:hypothetical protein
LLCYIAVEYSSEDVVSYELRDRPRYLHCHGGMLSDEHDSWSKASGKRRIGETKEAVSKV